MEIGYICIAIRLEFMLVIRVIIFGGVEGQHKNESYKCELRLTVCKCKVKLGNI